MNILHLQNYRIFNTDTQKTKITLDNTPMNISNFGLKLSAPLQKDIVNFKGGQTSKMMNPAAFKNGLIPYQRVIDICRDAEKWQYVVDDICYKIWGDMVATETNPEAQIKYITGKAKSALSALLKLTRRSNEADVCDTVEKAMEELTDKNRKKIVLRNAGRREVSELLGRLITAVNVGLIEVIEQDSKRPMDVVRIYEDSIGKKLTKEELDTIKIPEKIASTYDYSPTKVLQRIQDAQLEKWNGKRPKLAKQLLEKSHIYDCHVEDFTKGNYCGLHYLIRVPAKGGKHPHPIVTFELQILGVDENATKNVNDIIWKWYCGKEQGVPEAFKPMLDILNRHFNSVPKGLSDEEKLEFLNRKSFEKEEYKRYNDDAMIFARKKNVKPFAKKDAPMQFLELTDDYKISNPEDLDYASMYELHKKCYQKYQNDQAEFDKQIEAQSAKKSRKKSDS